MESNSLNLQVDSPSHVLIASDRVEGTPVRRRSGDKIGTVERLMVEKASGKVAYAVMTFGGFMGFGKKHVPVPWALLHYDPKLQAYQLDMSDADLFCVQSDDEFDWGDRTDEEVEAQARRYFPGHWGAY